MSPDSITPPYLTYFFIISYFFNFVKNFFTLTALDTMRGNHFLAGGLLHTTLITIRKTHIIFPFHLFILLSVQFQSHASHQGFIFPFLCRYCLSLTFNTCLPTEHLYYTTLLDICQVIFSKFKNFIYTIPNLFNSFSIPIT